jgi:hypothetical protein
LETKWHKNGISSKKSPTKKQSVSSGFCQLKVKNKQKQKNRKQWSHKVGNKKGKIKQ